MSKSKIDIITAYFWDKRLMGPTQKRLIEELYEEYGVPAMAVAQHNKIDVS